MKHQNLALLLVACFCWLNAAQTNTYPAHTSLTISSPSGGLPVYMN